MVGLLLIINIAMFEPETCLVSYQEKSAWLSYPGQYSVSIDRDVVAHLIWYSDYGAYASYAIWYAERVIEWCSFEMLYYDMPEYSSHPSIAAIDRYNFFAAWEGRSSHYKISLLRAEGWNRIVDVISPDTIHSFTPSLVLDSDTTLHILWQGDRNILYRNFKHGILSPITIITNTPYAINPSVNSYGNKLVVVWSDLKSGIFDIYLRVFDEIWEDEIRITASSGSSRFPVVTFDNLGIIHIAYTDDRDGRYKIYYMQFDGEKQDERLEVDSPGDALYPSITATPDGVVHLSWADDRDGNYEVYYKVIGSEQIERITKDSGSSSYPIIISDIEGGLWIFYQDRRNVYGEIYYTTMPPEKEIRPYYSFYPNPSKGDISVSSEPVKVYDVSGRYIGTFRNSFRLSPGIYFISSEGLISKIVVIR
ncbi:hypothetical protein KAX02_09155 [candidate division WOR-3 bacterium]|nr:hypothetical protein [candidate division WOR-3 bacterium]